jgi:hypothetical protein
VTENKREFDVLSTNSQAWFCATIRVLKWPLKGRRDQYV